MENFGKWAFAALGALWCWVEPTLPYALICIFAVLLDCVSAWRLNRRVKQAHPNSKVDGKFKSAHAVKMIADMAMAFGCMLLAALVDRYILTSFDMDLGNYVAAIFCFVQLWSILENESSCNGSAWAKVLQKFMVDKTKRHLDVDIAPTRKRKEAKKWLT